MFLVLACLAVAYPFFFPVILQKNVTLKNDGQVYFTAQEVSFKASLPLIIQGSLGNLWVKDVTLIDKFKFQEIKSVLRVGWKKITLDALSADSLGGKIIGRIELDFHDSISCAAVFNVKNVIFQRIMETLEITERADLTGIGSGLITVEVKRGALAGLQGHITASPEGGTLIINDKKWLQQIADYARQDINVIVENFKNYRYNVGTFNIQLKDANIVLESHFSGEAGKRDLVVVLHDVNHF